MASTAASNSSSTIAVRGPQIQAKTQIQPQTLRFSSEQELDLKEAGQDGSPNRSSRNISSTSSSSCCSLTSTPSSSSNSNSNGSSEESATRPKQATTKPTGGSSLKRQSPGMKSSYALTSLLQQHQDQQDGDGETERKAQSMLLSKSMSLPPSDPSTGLTDAMAKQNLNIHLPPPIAPAAFGNALQEAIDKQKQTNSLDFTHNSTLRQVLEPSLRYARRQRELFRSPYHPANCKTNQRSMQMQTPTPTPAPTPLPLSSWVGLPYASLRDERPFLYDHMHTHPLCDILRQTLGLNDADEDLSQMHQTWNPKQESAKEHQRRVFAPLLQDYQKCQEAYDSFVTSCCIPLLHASALQKGVFNSSSPLAMQSSRIVYRYHVFPTINVVYPNDPDACVPPSCDISRGPTGASTGWLHFHVPLTASTGSSALYTEHYPGKEDWHPLRCNSLGLGFCWDGARCLSFTPLNTTGNTRISLDFRVLLVRASTIINTNAMNNYANAAANANAANDDMMNNQNNNNHHKHITMDDDNLCGPEHLRDSFMEAPGFYKEAHLHLGTGIFVTSSNNNMDSYHHQQQQQQHRRRSTGDIPRSVSPVADAKPDARCGFPFQP